jgi:hypothetical protein
MSYRTTAVLCAIAGVAGLAFAFDALRRGVISSPRSNKQPAAPPFTRAGEPFRFWVSIIALITASICLFIFAYRYAV